MSLPIFPIPKAPTPNLRVPVASVFIALIVLGLKFLAYQYTGSTALLSDALESIINVVAAGVALFALWVASRPADANHPYGHSKAEYLSAVLESVFIVLAALSILAVAIPELWTPKQLLPSSIGLGINLVATIINGIWASVLLRTGRVLRSPALIADGQHLRSDVVTSIGVLVGVVLAQTTGLAILDPILAILVALNILWSGGQLLSSSLGGLMDEGVAPETEQRIRHVMSENATGALEMHDLRTRHSGRITFVEFHMVVPGNMTVSEAHDICDRLEEAIAREIDGVNVTIHIEPQDMAKHKGVLVL